MEYDDGWCKTCGVPLTIEQQPDPQQSVYQQPDPQQSVYQQPDPQQPVYQQPDPQQPVYQQPDPQQPVHQQPDPQQSVHQQPDPQQPVHQQPDPQQPVYQQPDPQQPVYQQPDPQQSVYQQPDPQQPVYQQPDPQQSVHQQPDIQQPVYQQPDPQQPMFANFKNKISKLNPLSKKIENQQAIPHQAIPQQPTPATSAYIGKLILPDKSVISINQIEKQFGREDFIRNVPEDILKYISRNHFKILNENGNNYIEDTNSLGGTKLNTNEIKMTGKQQLNDGDKIFIADSLELIFCIN